MGQLVVLFGIIAFASIKLLPAVIGLVRAMQTIKFNLPSIKVLEDLIDYKIEKKQFDKKEVKDKLNIEQIKFKNVNFQYPAQNKYTLAKVNFEIKKGDIVGLIGETGSGKTTLLNLIASLIKPKDGLIEINNLNYETAKQNFMLNIGYVSQSVYLADDSVFYNISLNNSFSDEDKKRMLKILDSLNLRYLNNKPIENILSIGEKGSRLSGGQVQRIGIARAVFRDPSILILDEATNALDKVNEEKILNFIFKKFINKIVIICTHKKELLKYCNKVIELKEDSLEIRKN